VEPLHAISEYDTPHYCLASEHDN